MTNLRFQVTLNSDALFSDGNEAPGRADVTFATDDFGFPQLGGRRLKGLLVEQASELLSNLNDPTLEEIADQLFGSPGRNDSRLVHFGNASLPLSFRKNVVSAGFTPNHIAEALGVVRSMTAQDEQLGIPKEGTLRNYEMICRSVSFEGSILTVPTLSSTEVALLDACIASVRRGGIWRSRGFGMETMKLTSDLEMVNNARKAFWAPRGVLEEA
jgi:hypothetical protein